MSSLLTQQTIGLLRSLLIYYNPWQYGRLAPFYAPLIQPGDLCFDIGAHVGNHVSAWLSLGARVVAVEPQPLFMRWLRWRYGRLPQVALVEQAVGAAENTQPLFISPRHPTVTTLSQPWITAVQQDASFQGVMWKTAVSIPVTTLETLITRYGEPTFCKIDVEGYELEVLKGLSRPLRALSFEYIPAAIHLATACVERLERLGEYEFNWTVGEKHQWQTAVWLSPTQIKEKLFQLKGKSGDVYARNRLIARNGR